MILSWLELIIGMWMTTQCTSHQKTHRRRTGIQVTNYFLSKASTAENQESIHRKEINLTETKLNKEQYPKTITEVPLHLFVVKLISTVKKTLLIQQTMRLASILRRALSEKKTTTRQRRVTNPTVKAMRVAHTRMNNLLTTNGRADAQQIWKQKELRQGTVEKRLKNNQAIRDLA
ncbi:hypothetical protein M758_UG244800 [Ceratodon purpureus]|nr:hypothetical protein M758_UG244800 [Ceratodon purpureus]